MEKSAEAPKGAGANFIVFVILALFIIFTRYLSSVPTPHSWDAVQYVLAVENYDVINHQPHPPGAPLLILLMRAVSLFTSSPHLALVYLNIAMSVVTLLMTLIVVKRMFGSERAIMTAAILASSQTFAFYGSTSNAYISEGFAGVAIALFCWLSLSRRTWYYAILSAILLAASGAFRQFIVVTMFPLWLFANSYLRKKPLLLTIVIVLFICTIAVWFIPTVGTTGSYKEYSEASNLLYSAIMQQHSFFGQFPYDSTLHNLRQLFIYLFFSFNIFIAPFFLLPFCFFSSVAQTTDASQGFGYWWSKQPQTLKFLVIWTVPPLCFYCLLHIPKPGYLMTVLPALATLLVFMYEVISNWLERHWSIGRNRAKITLLLLTIAVNGLCFLLLPQHINEIFYGDNLYQFTRNAIKSRHQSFQMLRKHIISKFPKDETAIFIYKRGGRLRLFRELSLLLRKYPVFEVNSMGDSIGFKEEKAIHNSFGTYEGRLLLELSKDFKEFMDADKKKSVKISIGDAIGITAMRPDFPAEMKTLPLSGRSQVIVITPARRTGKIAIVGAKRVYSEIVGPFRLKVAMR